MRKAILIIALLILCALGFGQDKPKHSGRIGTPKAKPTPIPTRNIDDPFDPIPADEILFDKMDYSLLDGRVGWRLANRSEERFSYYDVDRIQNVGRNKQAWIRTEAYRDDALLSVWLDLNEFDCGSQPRIALVETTKYGKDGKVSSRFEQPERSRVWERVVPDSIGERIYNIICRNGKDQERLDMEEAAIWFRFGVQAKKRKDYKAALTHFEKAEELAPRNRKILEEVILARALVR